MSKPASIIPIKKSSSPCGASGAEASHQPTMRERSGDLRNYWYAAAQACNLKAKKPLSVVIMETRIVLWRNEEGRAIALRDRCLHHNTFLSPGDITEQGLKCPYHGWTFDENGVCVNVPSEGEDGKGYPNRKVESFHAQEAYGLVWVWMGYGEPDPERQPFPMPHYQEKGWNTYYMETPFSNRVTSLVENFMDVPHTVFVHKGWFRDRKKLKVDSTVERTANSVIVTYHAQDAIGFTEKVLNPKGLPMYHTDKFYMPNNTRVDYIYGEDERGFVITSTSTPISDFEANVFTFISYKFGWANLIFSTFLPWYTRQVIQQDVVIMENQGKSLQEAAPDFKSTPADTLHLFVESLRDYAMADGLDEQGKPMPPPKPISREVVFWI